MQTGEVVTGDLCFEDSLRCRDQDRTSENSQSVTGHSFLPQQMASERHLLPVPDI